MLAMLRDLHRCDRSVAVSFYEWCKMLAMLSGLLVSNHQSGGKEGVNILRELNARNTDDLFEVSCLYTRKYSDHTQAFVYCNTTIPPKEQVCEYSSVIACTALLLRRD
jgi:hypothetical protein